MLTSLFYFCIANTVQSMLIEYQNSRAFQFVNDNYQPLYDIFHLHLPYIPSCWCLSDIAGVLPLIIMLWSNPGCIWQFLFAQATLISFRTLLFNVTVLPTARAKERNVELKGLIKRPWYFLPAMHEYNDLIFSGHVATATLCLHWLVKFSLEWYVTLFLIFVTSLSVILTREHYSVDVFLGGYIGITLPLLLKSL